MRNIGIIMAVVGTIMMAITGFNYITREKVVDLGPVEVNKTENHPVRWSPIVGGILLVGGIVVIVSSKKPAAAH